MGMNVGGKKGGPVGDINVTPFVDVCLVLLIIFMVIVTVTMIQLGYLSKIPPAADPASAPPSADQIVVRVMGNCGPGQISGCKVMINKEEVPLNQLTARCRQLFQGRTMQMLFFTAEDEVNYENVMKVLDLIQEAGVMNIGIITEQISTDIIQ
jgi:biopolymer transport protein ExbD